MVWIGTYIHVKLWDLFTSILHVCHLITYIRKNVIAIPKDECRKQLHMLVCTSKHISPGWRNATSHPASQSHMEFQEPNYCYPVPVGIQGEECHICCCQCGWYRCWYCKSHWDSLVKLKGPLLDAATEISGLSRDHRWRPKISWWNGQADEIILEKHAWLKSY